MPRLFHHRILGMLLVLGGLGRGTSAMAQVPNHPERIRETTRDILDRPEFGLFPRLNPGEPARGLSRRSPGGGIPRLKSSTGRRPEPGNGGGRGAANPAGQGQRGAKGDRARRGRPNRAPPNLPGDNPRGANGNPQNAQEALGNENLFPEAGRLNGVENQDLNLKPEERPDQKDLNNANQPANPNPGDDRAGNQGNPRGGNKNPQPRPNGNPPNAGLDNRGLRNPRHAGGGVNPNHNEALPAPRPRESAPSEQNESATQRKTEAGGLAQIVGTMFHVMAWTILAVICGLIIWLIGKAILELERPAAWVPSGANSGSALEWEPSRAPGELPADVYVTQARKLAEQGLFREAVVQLLMGAMSRVERAGWVRFRQGLTVRDYLRGVDQHPAAYQGLRSIIRVFEPLTFGRREPTQAHFDKSLKGYESGFGLD